MPIFGCRWVGQVRRGIIRSKVRLPLWGDQDFSIGACSGTRQLHFGSTTVLHWGAWVYRSVTLNAAQ